MTLNDIYLVSQIAAAVLVAPTLKDALGGPEAQSAQHEETGR